MQGIIDRVKSGKNDSENLRNLLRLLEEKLQQAKESGKPITHILLCCTELPLALSFRDETGEFERALKILKTNIILSILKSCLLKI